MCSAYTRHNDAESSCPRWKINVGKWELKAKDNESHIFKYYIPFCRCYKQDWGLKKDLSKTAITWRQDVCSSCVFLIPPDFRAFPGPGLITENRYPIMCCCKARSHAFRDQHLAGCCKASLETFCLLKDRNYRIHMVLGSGLCWGSLLARHASVPNELAADKTSSSFSRFLTLQKSFYVLARKLCRSPARLNSPWIFRIPKEDKWRWRRVRTVLKTHNKVCPKGHAPPGRIVSVFQWSSEQLTGGSPQQKSEFWFDIWIWSSKNMFH